LDEHFERAEGADGWIAARNGDEWHVLGSRCRSCARLAAPADRFGCLQCGAPTEQVDFLPLSGRGTLLNAVTVFQPLIADATVPLVIGRIALEEGPVVSAQIGVEEEQLSPGMALQAEMVGASASAAGAWRFNPAEEARA